MVCQLTWARLYIRVMPQKPVQMTVDFPILSPNNLFAIPSSELNSAPIPLLLSLVFFLRCSLYGYEFFEFYYCLEKMECDGIHCYKMLLDLEGTRRGPVLHILLKIYSYYFFRCPTC